MSAYALTTKSRIKDRLQITATSFDTVIDRLILAVTDRIERMCGRRFYLTTHTNETHDGSDPAYQTQRVNLILKNAPVTALTSLQYNAGTNSDPDWTDFDEDDYDVDMEAGIVYFHHGMPCGRRNIRATYTAGYNGFSLGTLSSWVFNALPTGAVNGVNLTFTLPTDCEEIIVYADGMRELASNYTFTAGTDTFTFAAGRAPVSALTVDYLPSTGEDSDSDDYTLPTDLVEVCEEAVCRIFKRREAEGRASETLGESTITYTENVFTKENTATVKNYRRGNYL